MNDTYLTLESYSEGLLKDKGSKFLAFAYPVDDVEEIKTILEQKRKEYYDARHVCYAYVLGHSSDQFRANDDGEPSGTAGRPILGQINSLNLTNVLVIVVRYFGGILLGTSGLITAYKGAAQDVLQNAVIVERIVENKHTITFFYEQMNDVMKIMKNYDLKIISQEYELKCQLTFTVRLNLEEMVLTALSKIDYLKCLTDKTI